MKNTFSSQSDAGFSLIELLVSITIGMMIIVIIAMMTSAGSRMSIRIQSNLSTRHDAKVALDYFERDISTITTAEPGRSTLAVVPEQVAGPNGMNASSFWIMMLSRPAESSGVGAIRAVSYRLVYTDPMNPNGSQPRYALFRTAVSPKAGEANSFLRVPDLHTGYWTGKWSEYLAENSGRALLDDYLLENPVELKAELHYTYSDATGNQIAASVTPEEPVYWTTLGFTGGGIPEGHTPNVPVSISLTFTVLNATGVNLAESGSVPFDEIIKSEGITVNQTFPILIRRAARKFYAQGAANHTLNL